MDCSTPGFPVLHILEISLSGEEPINTIFKKERWEGGGIKDTIERNSKNKNIMFKKLEKKKKDHEIRPHSSIFPNLPLKVTLLN